jgi:hypothetical protein
VVNHYEIIVNLISNTKTASCLKVTCKLDHRKYDLGKKLTKEQFSELKIKPKKIHREWNYKIYS